MAVLFAGAALVLGGWAVRVYQESIGLGWRGGLLACVLAVGIMAAILAIGGAP